MTSLADRLRQRAAQEGFNLLRIAPATEFAGAGARLREFVALGRHGDMDWIEDTIERRGDPQRIWAEARSAIMLAASYTPKIDPMARLKKRGTGVISVYAMGRDYHDVVKGMLKRLGQWLAHESGAGIKVFVDTAPLMEKPLAQAAGLGWQGKHTNLLSRELGSWFFIGTILTTMELPFDKPETDHCGACRACLDICPTHAFPAPYQLDARRCISYLTIEHKGHIAREFREAIGNRIYGCDDCLAVCPWNKFAKAAHARLEARDDLVAPPLAELVELDDAAFRAKFAGTAIKRTGRNRFVRNALIALGNSGDPELAAVAERRLGDASPLVRAMAVWALSRLATPGRFSALRQQHLASETDTGVRSEWLPA